ncbi:MAG: EAL domain-containing protein [Sulfuriferula sp.]
MLAESHLPANFLELEITETALIGDMGSSIAKLNELSALGVRLALDDFGTRYSSFSYLRHLPIDSLKIDRSFVIDIVENTQSAAIVPAIIGLAHGPIWRWWQGAWKPESSGSNWSSLDAT